MFFHPCKSMILTVNEGEYNQTPKVVLLHRWALPATTACFAALSSEPEFRVCMRVGLGARVCTSGSECGRRMKKPAWRQAPTHLPCRSQAAGCCGVRRAGRDGRKLTARGGARICWLLVLAPGEEKYGQLLTVSVSLEMDNLLCA